MGPTAPTHPRRDFLKRNIPWILVALLSACAPSRKQAPSGRRSRGCAHALRPSPSCPRPRAGTVPAVESHGSLPPGRDPWRGDWAAATNWLTLATPGTPFQPIRPLRVPAGISTCSIASAAAWRCTTPMPSSCPPSLCRRNSSTATSSILQVQWTRDGIFTFLDLSEGIAWQYSEIRVGVGQGDWRLINRIRLPLNLEVLPLGALLPEPLLPGPRRPRLLAGRPGDPHPVLRPLFQSHRFPASRPRHDPEPRAPAGFREASPGPPDPDGRDGSWSSTPGSARRGPPWAAASIRKGPVPPLPRFPGSGRPPPCREFPSVTRRAPPATLVLAWGMPAAAPVSRHALPQAFGRPAG